MRDSVQYLHPGQPVEGYGWQQRRLFKFPTGHSTIRNADTSQTRQLTAGGMGDWKPALSSLGSQQTEFPNWNYFLSGIFLQTITVCPVFESIRVVTGSQRQVTVFAFSCLLTTQCSIASALAGGIWLRTGAGAAGWGGGGGTCATGFFLAGQPASNRTQTRIRMDQSFLIAPIGDYPPNITLPGCQNL